jgi:hypothetical protein
MEKKINLNFLFTRNPLSFFLKGSAIITSPNYDIQRASVATPAPVAHASVTRPLNDKVSSLSATATASSSSSSSFLSASLVDTSASTSTNAHGQSAVRFMVEQTANPANPNADICDALQRVLATLTHDRMRHLSFRKAIAAIKAHPHRIETGADAAAIPGIGASISRTIEEFLTTGRSKRQDNVSERDAVRRLFEGIYGKKAKVVYNME